ncbi:MAG: hypothetical protein GY729_22220 [Desulfobacteraceae bacterium]|nr:hypothetical protein [Desulfobacteraceae bacterium]
MAEGNYIRKICKAGDTLCILPTDKRTVSFALTYLGQDGTSFHIRAMTIDDQNRIIGHPMGLIYKIPSDKKGIKFSFREFDFIAQAANNSYLKCLIPASLEVNR